VESQKIRFYFNNYSRLTHGTQSNCQILYFSSFYLIMRV